MTADEREGSGSSLKGQCYPHYTSRNNLLCYTILLQHKWSYNGRGNIHKAASLIEGNGLCICSENMEKNSLHRRLHRGDGARTGAGAGWRWSREHGEVVVEEKGSHTQTPVSVNHAQCQDVPNLHLSPQWPCQDVLVLAEKIGDAVTD